MLLECSMNKISSAPCELSHGIVGVHFGSSVLAFLSLLFSHSYSMVQKVKLKKELNIISNILRWMVITIGQKRILLKINHAKEEQLMIAAVKWLYMVGTSEPQRNKRIKKKMEGHETYMIYEESVNLMNSHWRLQKPEKSLLDEYLDKRVTWEGLMFSDQMGITNENRMRNKTNEIFYCIWFLYGITCNEGTIFLCIPI